MELIGEHQLNIMLAMATVCGLLAFFSLFMKQVTSRRKHVLTLMSLEGMFLLIFDRYAYIYRGQTGSLAYAMVRISNFCVAMRYVRNRTDADDVYSDVFCRYFRRKRTFDSEEHRKAWLLRVTGNCSKEFLINRKYGDELNEDMFGSETLYGTSEASAEDIMAVREALKNLDDDYREIIELVVIMKVNKNEKIPASQLFWLVTGLILFLTVADTMEMWCASKKGTANELEIYVKLRTVCSAILYIVRPMVILTEVFIIIPNKKYRFVYALPAVVNAVYFSTVFFGNRVPFYIDKNNLWHSNGGNIPVFVMHIIHTGICIMILK